LQQKKIEKAFTLPNIVISQNEKKCLIAAPQITEEQIITNDLAELINDNQFIFSRTYR
jgi:O-succinylbenzoic acid--CoA ligase